MGDIPFGVDGKPVNWHDTVNYRGMMFTGVPNMALGVWLFPRQLDAAGRHAGRFCLQPAEPHGRQIGAKRVEVALRDEDRNMPL